MVTQLEETLNNLRKEYVIAEVARPVSWAHDVSKGDLVIIGHGWDSVHIKTGVHYHLPHSSLKYKRTILLKDRFSSLSLIQQYQEETKFEDGLK